MEVGQVINVLNTLHVQLLTKDTLHILNGQQLAETFQHAVTNDEIIYIPFNEAMCVHPTTIDIFSEHFCEVRAKGHDTSIEAYQDIVVKPLQTFFQTSYKTIVLWFGKDVFCQMNVLTILAYLEQIQYKGTVYVNAFVHGEGKVEQIKIRLGTYMQVYTKVLVNGQLAEQSTFPMMQKAIHLYLELLQEENDVANYVKKYPLLAEEELTKQLMLNFKEYGYGDTQYKEMIQAIRNKVV
jgi:hypothetical protein